MVYLRKPRPSYYFEAKLKVGFKQMCTHTSDKRTAQRMEHMWSSLADQRAWDLLEPVVEDSKKIGALYDVWKETREDLGEMRRRANDVNVEPLVEEWRAKYEQGVEADTAKHALAHVRFLFPEGVSRLVSTINADWLTTRLVEYPAKKRNTRRKVHSSWSVFFDYLVMPKKLFAASPMLHVERPTHEKSMVEFYDSAVVDRIIAWHDELVRRAFFSLVYGTGADVSPALLVTREGINAATKEVRIAGTKTAQRDRIVRVNDALWPAFWKHAKTVIAGPIFPAEWNRWTASDWHRYSVGEGEKDTHGTVIHAGLKLSPRLPLRKARHHFAVRLLQAGTPVRVVAEQLGSDERTVLKHYGPWIVSAEDRAKWEKIATKHETKRRKAE